MFWVRDVRTVDERLLFSEKMDRKNDLVIGERCGNLVPEKAWIGHAVFLAQLFYHIP